MRTVLVFLFVSLSGLYPLLGMSHGENDAPKPRLWTCKYGEFDLPENMIFPGGSKEKLQTISLLFHFIDFGERRILVDVGCDKFFFLGRTAEHFIRPDELLRKNGIAPETITDCLITHHHDDHIGSLASFPDARVYIQAKEAERAKKLLYGRAVTTFDEQLELFGGRMILRRVGGHTSGHSVVEIPLACGQVYVIAGDACYSPDNLVRKIPTASTGNAAESAAFFERYADPKYRILLGHEPTAPFGGNGIREVIHGVEFVEPVRWGGGRRIFAKDPGCRGKACNDIENQKSLILERAQQIMAQPGGKEKIYLEASGNVCEAAVRAYRERPDLFRALAVSDVPATWRGVKGGDVWQYVVEGERMREIVEEGEYVRTLGDVFKTAEGATVDPVSGDLFFSDFMSDEILRWNEADGVRLFKRPAGHVNGMLFRKDGTLLACSMGENELQLLNRDGTVRKVLAKGFGGRDFNGPNDVWERPDGSGWYFTDPFYRWKEWSKYVQPPMDTKQVYYVTANGEVIRVTDDLVEPNGITGTPDGKTLYVADHRGRKCWAYSIDENGRLSDKRLFCDIGFGTDGMTIDADGRLYMTAEDINVWDRNGEKLGVIRIPEFWCGNCCIGGPDKNILYVCGKRGVYSIKLKVRGVRGFAK